MAVNVDTRRWPVAREVAAVRCLVKRKGGLSAMEVRSVTSSILAVVLALGVILMILLGRAVPVEYWGLCFMAVSFYVGQAVASTPARSAPRE